ncbi:MAG: hypothetical protein KF726_03040 [Anaerolineae bacterium]|nr:hypothetical protein [Anaerolineae bacterium]
MSEKPDSESLRRMLEEDTDSPEIDDLLPAIQQLRTWSAPPPTSAQTDHLIATLETEFDRQVQTAAPRVDRQLWAWTWALIRVQLRVVRRGLWWASAFVMLLGVLVTLLTISTQRDVFDLPLTLAAPLIAAIGLALLYDEDTLVAQEIELATPTPPILLMLVRLMLIFGFNLLLALIGSLALALLTPSLSLWSLIGAWLAPMTFLSALSFFFSVITADATSGAFSGLLLWSLIVGMRALKINAPTASLWSLLPDFLSEAGRSWLLLFGLAIFALALWISDWQPSFTRRHLG